jgi:hypothetical protein
MNHHLRFVSPALFTAGAILSASSCSSTKVGPLLAKPEHEITYEIRIFDVPVDHHFGSRSSEVLSATQGAALIRRLHREPAFFATTSGKLGETKTVSNRKEFIYPSAYSPAEFAKPGETGIFPVTPAQPKDFVTTWVGTTVAFKEMRSSSDMAEILVSLDRKVLLGFVNSGKPITAPATDLWGRKVEVVITENRIEMPRFARESSKEINTLKTGEFLVLRNAAASPPETNGLPFAPKRSQRYLAMIRATRR